MGALSQVILVSIAVILGVLGVGFWSVAPAFSSPFEEDFLYQKQFVEVHGSQMAYVDTGIHASGRTFVFLHGNPTSSYLWRNVIPHLEAHGRCIAPDLIGMGDSDKLTVKKGEDGDVRYSFQGHRRHLWSLLEKIGAVAGSDANVVLVIHDWGSALGFDWAANHENAVLGIAFMESILPVGGTFRTENVPFVTRSVFESVRSSLGELLILKANLFIEFVLPHSIIRPLSWKEMGAYKAPYANEGEDRRPTLTWPREVPFDGQPADVANSITAYEAWLEESPIPKLWINAEPGAIMLGPMKEYARSLPNTQEVVLTGKHFIQEDHPHEIGKAIALWQAQF